MLSSAERKGRNHRGDRFGGGDTAIGRLRRPRGEDAMTVEVGRRQVRLLVLLVTLAAAVLSARVPAATADEYERVDIVRDSHGEPHIRAVTARGAAYGFAYAQMEDQALEVLTGIRRAAGRLAEVQGPDCLPNCFISDQLTRLFRVPDSAAEKFATLPLDSRRRLRSFADGINAYIDAHP